MTEDMSDKFRMFDILDVDMGGRAGGRESQTLKVFFLKQHFKMGPLNCRKQNETNKGKQETVWFFGHIPFWHLGPQVHLA